MKINKTISDFIENNYQIMKSLQDNKWDAKLEKVNFTRFINLLESSKYNYQLGLEFTFLLQLNDDKSICEQYSLENIRDLFTSLIELKRGDLDNYIEASHYEWAVMDDKEKALDIIETGIKTAELKIQELKKLKRDIKK